LIKPHKPLREISVRRVIINISSSINADCRVLKNMEKTNQKNKMGDILMTYLGFNFQCLKTKLDMTRARVIQSTD
jgi:hypothetical protein